MEKTALEDEWHVAVLEESRGHGTDICDHSISSRPCKARSPNRPRRTVTKGNHGLLETHQLFPSEQRTKPSSTGSGDVGAGNRDSDRTLQWTSLTFLKPAVPASPSPTPWSADSKGPPCQVGVRSPRSSVTARLGSVQGFSFVDNAEKALNALFGAGRKHCRLKESPALPLKETSEASHLNVAVNGELGDGVTMSEISLADESGVSCSRRPGDWPEEGCHNDVPLRSTPYKSCQVAIRGQRASCRANETPSWCSSLAGPAWSDLPTGSAGSCRSSSSGLWQTLLERKTCLSRSSAFILPEDKKGDEPSMRRNTRLFFRPRDSAERTVAGEGCLESSSEMSYCTTPQDLLNLDEQRDLPASRPVDRGLSLLCGRKDKGVPLSSDDGGNEKSGALPLKMEITADGVQSDSECIDRGIEASELNFRELSDSTQHLFPSTCQGEGRRTKQRGQPNRRMSEAIGQVVCALRHAGRHLGNQLRVIMFVYGTCAGKPDRSPDAPVRV